MIKTREHNVPILAADGGGLNLTGLTFTSSALAAIGKPAGLEQLKAMYNRLSVGQYDPSWRLIRPEEFALLSEPCNFVESLRARYGVPSDFNIQFHVGKLASETTVGMGNGFLRAVAMSESFLKEAEKDNRSRATIDGNGSLVHEFIHAMGVTSITLQQSIYLGIDPVKTVQGLKIQRDRSSLFDVLEEYLPTRAQSAYYQLQGSTEVNSEFCPPDFWKMQTNSSSLCLAIASKLDLSVKVNPNGSIDTNLPSVEQDIRKNNCYGVVRRAVYEIARRMFPEQTRDEAIESFDRLAHRAHALGERKELFAPMTKAIGNQAVNALGLITFHKRYLDPYILVAALGETIKAGGDLYEYRIAELLRAANAQTLSVSNERVQSMLTI